MKDNIVKYLAVGLVLSPLTSTSLVSASDGFVEEDFYATHVAARAMSADGSFFLQNEASASIEDDFEIVGGKLVADASGDLTIQDNPFHVYTSEPDFTTGQKLKFGVVNAGKAVVNGYCAVENLSDKTYNLYKGFTSDLTDEQIAAMTGAQVNQHNKGAESLAYWSSWARWGYRLGAGGMAVARNAGYATDFVNQQAFELCYAGCTKYAGMSPYTAAGVATIAQHGAKAYSGTAVNTAIWTAAAYAPEVAYHTVKAPRYAYETGKFVYNTPGEVVSMVKAVPGKIGAAVTSAVDTAVATKEAVAPYIAKADAATQPVRTAISSAVSSVVSSGFSAIKSGWSYFTSAPAA